MAIVKTAISLEQKLFQRAEEFAHSQKLSRLKSFPAAALLRWPWKITFAVRKTWRF